MGVRENECQMSENYILDINFSEFYLYFHNSCEFWHSFSRTLMTNFLWCYYRWQITSLALEKCKKECNILWIILVQGFCPLKIKITQFPGGFRLNTHRVFRSCNDMLKALVVFYTHHSFPVSSYHVFRWHSEKHNKRSRFGKPCRCKVICEGIRNLSCRYAANAWIKVYLVTDLSSSVCLVYSGYTCY